MYYLDLIAHRDISNQIAVDFGVEHESPQFILIKNGEATYHESHYGINLSEILEKV
jgi:bacillithiol system protein YtxJ